MNILVTSAGRRGYIIEYFKEALCGKGKVYAGNSTPLSSAFYYADERVVTPLIYDKNYIPFLLDFCKEKQIEMIVSLFDIDLLVLSKNKKLFEECGVRVLVSDENVVTICNDKWKTYEFCLKNNIPVPKTYLSCFEAKKAVQHHEIELPVIVKPRWGMGSLGVYCAENISEVDIFTQKCKMDIQNTYLKYEAVSDIDNCTIIQEKLSGEEYGIDIFNNLSGEYCGNVTKKKYSMRAGETDCAMVVKNELVDKFAYVLGNTLRHIANLDVDIFINEGKIFLLEMNARFGGGYPFSHLAGINLPRAIIKWINNEKLTDELIIKKWNQVIQKDIKFVNLSESEEQVLNI